MELPVKKTKPPMMAGPKPAAATPMGGKPPAKPALLPKGKGKGR